MCGALASPSNLRQVRRIGCDPWLPGRSRSSTLAAQTERQRLFQIEIEPQLYHDT
jgi:hypothetical protein